MALARRSFLSAMVAAAWAAPRAAHAAVAAPPPGRNVTSYGVRPNAESDQSAALQRAINACAADGEPLFLPAGRYLCSSLTLPSGSHLVGVRETTRLVATAARPLMTIQAADTATLSNLILDGRNTALPARTGLLLGQNLKSLFVRDCAFVASGGNGIWLDGAAGILDGNRFDDCAASGLVSFNATGLIVSRNSISRTRENGIEILRSEKGDDGTQVIDNRIESIAAGPGGSGQYGNGIVVYRAGNVLVHGNRIRACDYSGVRGNSSDNIQIIGNGIRDAREVAIYSEFSFTAAVIANNIIDGAALGISVCNFNEGGRIAAVQGNIVRNLLSHRPAGSSDGQGGIGIYVEADAAVAGNIVEAAPFVGIMAGWGKYLRDVAITGNVVRDSFIGVGVSVFPGAGNVLVNGNSLAGSARGAVVGMDHAKPVTPDLVATGAGTFSHLVLGTNQTR